LALFVFGRAFDYLFLQASGLFGVILALIYSRFGSSMLKHLAFPLVYLAYMVPVPGWVLDHVTAPLKHFASFATTELLQIVGVPVAREGVILFVDQYQLLVEDACAGLNALSGLMALGLFYAYIAYGPSWRYGLLLTAVIIPVAVAANIVRITILVLLTLWGGNDAAQGYLHGTAGLVMFSSALSLVFLIDSLLRRVRRPTAAVVV
jgi:exosortase